MEESGSKLPTSYTVEETQPYVGEVSGVLSQQEVVLSLVVIFFGLIVIGVEYLLLKNANAQGDLILKIMAVSVIIIGTMFVITAGYSAEQIAPAIGLFGTIAGYLLGKSHASKSRDD